MNKFISLLLLLIVVCFCLHGEIREVTILQTTDIHAARDIAKLTAALLEEKEKTPLDQMLLIDCGDLTQGSLEASLDHGKTTIDFLNTVKFDVFVPGNHDFDYGTNVFCQNLQNIHAKTLCANLELSDSAKAVSFYKWTMFRRNGLNIAVIGFTIPYLDSWIPPEITRGVKLQQLQHSIEEVMPEIRKARPDFIILAAHLGHISAGRLTNQKGVTLLKSQMRSFPEISLVLGGHTHQDIAGEILLKNTLYVQAPYHARGYAKIIVQYDTEKKQVKNIFSTLQFINANTFETDVSPAWRKNIEKADDFGNQHVANVPFPLVPLKKPQTPSQLAMLFAEAMAKKAGVTCGFSGTYTSAVTSKGAITEKQVFELIPYENYICTLSLSPAEVKHIIEEQLQSSQKNSAMVPFGVSYQHTKNGKVIEPLIKTSDGSAWINESERIDFAFSSYVLCSGGGRYSYLKELTKKPETRYRVLHYTLRDAFRELLQKKYP